MALPPGFVEDPVPQPGGRPPAGFTEIQDNSQQPDSNYGDVVKAALNEARMGNGSKMRALLTDPITQAKALPYLAGTAGALSPIPGGATSGTVGGRQLSNLALKTYGREEEIPSPTEQVIEGAGAALGDLTAFPAINRKVLGKAVGQVESVLGDVAKEAPPSSARTAVKYVQGLNKKIAEGTLTPVEAKAARPAVKTIFQKGWLAGTEYMPDFVKANQGIQKVLNQIPGREEVAGNLARSQAIPNLIERGVKAIPRSVRYGLGVGTGVGGAGTLAYELGKKILGDR